MRDASEGFRELLSLRTISGMSGLLLSTDWGSLWVELGSFKWDWNETRFFKEEPKCNPHLRPYLQVDFRTLGHCVSNLKCATGGLVLTIYIQIECHCFFLFEWSLHSLICDSHAYAIPAYMRKLRSLMYLRIVWPVLTTG